MEKKVKDDICTTFSTAGNPPASGGGGHSGPLLAPLAEKWLQKGCPSFAGTKKTIEYVFFLHNNDKEIRQMKSPC